MFKVYEHVNLINGKIYIGITSKDAEDRWINGRGYKGQIFYNAIKKYGWNNFEHIVLFDNLNEQEAIDIEKELILYHKSYLSKYGYNADMGGKYAGKHSTVTKEKLKLNGSRREIICLETKESFISCKDAAQKMNLCYSSVAKCCKGNSRYRSVHGYHFVYIEDYDKDKHYDLKVGYGYETICLETKEIFKSATEAGRLLKLDVSSICKACKGKQKSVEGLHFKFIKDYNPNEEYDLRSDRDFIKKKVICIETGVQFNSIKEASEKMCLNSQGICAVLSNRQKTTGGYSFRYVK